MKSLSKTISTFFGAGYFPFAAGTFASFLVALLYYYLLYRLDAVWLGVVIGLVFFIGVAAATVHARELERKDPKPIVIDEVCGQLIAFLFVPGTAANVIAGFFLFRLFDVIKPWPIRKLEELPRGWGIMADDVLAGVFAAVVLHAYLLLR
jgi:phosphatidylglycerophosphatase A